MQDRGLSLCVGGSRCWRRAHVNKGCGGSERSIRRISFPRPHQSKTETRGEGDVPELEL